MKEAGQIPGHTHHSLVNIKLVCCSKLFCEVTSGQTSHKTCSFLFDLNSKTLGWWPKTKDEHYWWMKLNSPVNYDWLDPVAEESRVNASTVRAPRRPLSHPVPHSNITTWLNLKGKLSFDFLRRGGGGGGLAARLRDLFDAIPTQVHEGCHGNKGISCYCPLNQSEGSVCWKGLHRHRWSLKTLANQHFETWTVPFQDYDATLRLKSAHWSGVIALALLFTFNQFS